LESPASFCLRFSSSIRFASRARRTILGCALQQSLIALDLLVAAELVGELPLDEIVHGALLAVAGGSATGLSATDAWAWPLSVMGQHTLMGQQEANPSGAVPAQ
jgi:hypothetical protein